MIARRGVIFLVLILESIALVPAAPAAVLDDIARDFGPLSGYVVSPADDEFIIDRDATAGVAVGDLFSVVHPGEKIVHPVTGKVLGSLDRTKGVLQVTRIKSGYSFARPLEEKEKIARGDALRRFENIPAAFLDTTGRGKPTFDRLRTLLPGLDWKFTAVPADAKTPPLPEGTLLAFVLGPAKLEVRGPNGTLRSYQIPGDGGGTLPEASTGSRENRPDGRKVAAEPGERIRTSASADYTVRGMLPQRVLMADFVRDGDRLLLAATDGTKIEVFTVGDNLVRTAKGDAPRASEIHSLHWWQPDAGTSPLLAATMSVEENRAFTSSTSKTIMGVIFTLRNGGLTPTREEFPFLLGSFDRDGNGARETLLGQSFDRDIFFGDRIREFRVNGEKVTTDAVQVPVSRPFAVQGALFVDLTGDGRPETVFVRNRTLFVYQGTELLYESSQEMGGSLSVLTYDINPGAADRLFTNAAFEIPPVAVDLDGDGRMEVVAIASEGSGFAGIGSGIRKSRLATLAYHDGRFVRGTFGPDLEASLQGLYASRDGIFVVATQGSSRFKTKEASQLLFLPMNDRGKR